jgi:hypothetical protein
MNAYHLFTSDPVNYPQPDYNDFLESIRKEKHIRSVVIVDPGIRKKRNKKESNNNNKDNNAYKSDAYDYSCVILFVTTIFVRCHGGSEQLYCLWWLVKIWLLYQKLNKKAVRRCVYRYICFVLACVFLHKFHAYIFFAGKVWPGPTLFPSFDNPDVCNFIVLDFWHSRYSCSSISSYL